MTSQSLQKLHLDPLQTRLSKSFQNAIDLEQAYDSAATASYLRTYSPKKLASHGLAIVNLTVSAVKPWAGNTVLELSPDPATNISPLIPSSSVRVGDLVAVNLALALALAPKDQAIEGVVSQISAKSVHVLISDTNSDSEILQLYCNTGKDSARVSIVKLTDTASYKRMLQAVKRLESFSEGTKTEMIRILLGETSVDLAPVHQPELTFFDDSLNESQRSAIQFAVSSPIAIIHGPPGTGKTYTLIELIRQLRFKFGEKILVCGPSNTSVDNILERLAPVFASVESSKRKAKRKAGVVTKNPEKLIRIGHPARISPSNLRHCLGVLSKSSYDGEGGDNIEILDDIANDIRTTLTSIKSCKKYGERKSLWTELKTLRKELRVREKKVTHDLLTNAQVVLSTLHGSGANELYELYKDQEFSVDRPLFDTIIIDEVSQSLEPQCWIPLVNHIGCKRLIIAGDNRQLSAMVESKKEADKLRKSGECVADLEVTLFDRLMKDLHGEKFRKLLNIQYRMNSQIMEFPSQNQYDGLLKAGENVAHILLRDLDNVSDTEETSVACIWYDTQGGNFPEQTNDSDDFIGFSGSTGSKFNEKESSIVSQHIELLISAGVRPDQIGVISPYSAQVSLIRKELSVKYDSTIEVSTVDGFQGRENEVIILSLVRSNDNREVGFLNDPRRLNVAMTRPKRQLCVIGDMELLERSGAPFLVSWVKYAEEFYDLRYPD